MKTPKADKRFYKGRCYTFSPIRGCWKVYHSSQDNFMLMDFQTQSEVKAWIRSKI